MLFGLNNNFSSYSSILKIDLESSILKTVLVWTSLCVSFFFQIILVRAADLFSWLLIQFCWVWELELGEDSRTAEKAIRNLVKKYRKLVPKKGWALMRLGSRKVESTKRFSSILFQLCHLASLLILAHGFAICLPPCSFPFSLLWSELSASEMCLWV